MKPEDIGTPEYSEITELIDDLIAMHQRGELVSVAFVAERADDNLMMRWTRAQNVFSVAGYMQYAAMKRLKFVQEEEVSGLVDGELPES